MDAFVQLALIEKAKRVFMLNDEVTLCFPLLNPIVFSSGELKALQTASVVSQSAAQFARIVNFLPQGILANVSDQMLWEVYEDVLERAGVAVRDPSVSVDPAAIAILYETTPDGVKVESESLKRYRQYRDAWFQARENYAAKKSSGELSHDPVMQRQWTEEEPVLRAVIDAAAADWETLGQRVVIETARKAELDAIRSNPVMRWTDWRNAFDPNLDLITLPSGESYAPTGFAPQNFAEGDWLHFDLSADEMKVLAAGAPDTLKTMLDERSGVRYSGVSFEYRSVSILRPWFHSEVLLSRIWRSDDPMLALSDGGDPARGVCTAYASACIFVRNVQVVEQGQTQSKPLGDQMFRVRPEWLKERPTLRINPAVLERTAPVTVQTTQVSHDKSRPLIQALRRSSFDAIKLGPISRPAMAKMVRPDAVLVPGLYPARPQGGLPPSPLPAHDDMLSILAFICKKLPKTPDPLPQLLWS